MTEFDISNKIWLEKNNEENVCWAEDARPTGSQRGFLSLSSGLLVLICPYVLSFAIIVPVFQFICLFCLFVRSFDSCFVICHLFNHPYANLTRNRGHQSGQLRLVTYFIQWYPFHIFVDPNGLYWLLLWAQHMVTPGWLGLVGYLSFALMTIRVRYRNIQGGSIPLSAWHIRSTRMLLVPIEDYFRQTAVKGYSHRQFHAESSKQRTVVFATMYLVNTLCVYLKPWEDNLQKEDQQLMWKEVLRGCARVDIIWAAI